MAGLFDGVLARGGVPDAVSDAAWLQAMLDVEAGLARAQARVGLLTEDDAEVIAAVCDAERFDAAELGRQAAASGNPVVPLVRALTAQVGGAAAAHVHRGATSQDILDTAAMLVARAALERVIEDLQAAAHLSADLADRHRRTVMAGRTLLQQALPITFGLKAAGWLAGLDDALRRLVDVHAHRLAVQLGGGAGTLAPLEAHGAAVLGALADLLGLAEPPLPWHTSRTRIAELAGALGETALAVRKVAGDIVLLAQTEVGEVREVGPEGHGGSSTLPHKRNPVAAVAARACAAQAPGLVATLLEAAGQHEHERAAGAWHAEWRPLRALLVSVGSAVSWLRTSLERLEVDEARMRANLGMTGGLVLAERVTTALTPAVGRLAAHDLMQRASAAAAAQHRPLRDVLVGMDEVAAHLPAGRVDELLDPEKALGSAEAFIERSLAHHRRRLEEHDDEVVT